MEMPWVRAAMSANRRQPSLLTVIRQNKLFLCLVSLTTISCGGCQAPRSCETRRFLEAWHGQSLVAVYVSRGKGSRISHAMPAGVVTMRD